MKYTKKIITKVLRIFSYFLRTKRFNFYLYCRQLDKTNFAIQEKLAELMNRKCVVFHYTISTNLT